MDRDEILKKAKRENLFNDEAKNNKEKKGIKWGSIAALTVTILFAIVSSIKGKDKSQFLAIMASYLAFTQLGKYYANKERSDLLIFFVTLLMFFATFVIGMIELWIF